MLEDTKEYNSVRILKSLLGGGTMEYGGRTYFMYEGEIGIGLTRQRITDGITTTEELFMPMEITLNEFIKACKNFTIDEMFVMGANSVLNQMATEKIEARKERMKNE